MAFWGQELNGNSKEPKRKFRFKVQIGDLGGGIVWYAKSAGKPSMTIASDTTHKFMGHTFKYPGSVTWEDIDVTLVDPVSEDAATKLLEIVENSGYVYPNENYIKEQGDPRNRPFHTISKAKATSALSHVWIYQLDAEGNPIESWKLHNVFIKSVAFGDLSYEDEGLSEITLGLVFDWATFGLDEQGGVFDRDISS